ncbi:MAG: response regulator transcription factor [Clostridia bacterium]|jgi:two-component system response regulator NreC|nr:response regulator transcription factor [Clostridia bacterium]
MGAIQILIADDHAVLRSGLKMMLESQPDMKVIGEAGTGWEILDLVKDIKPDLCLLDLSMPGIGGLEIIPDLKKIAQAMKILVLTMHDDESYVRAVLKSGAHGYILKKAADIELLTAIRYVANGKIYLDPSLTHVLVDDLYGTGKDNSKVSGQAENSLPLSERETEVLILVAKGYTNQQIADQLVVSIKTVETHRSRIRKKLGLNRRSELVRYAFRQGLMQDA